MGKPLFVMLLWRHVGSRSLNPSRVLDAHHTQTPSAVEQENCAQLSVWYICVCVCVCGCVWVSPRAHPLCFLKLEQTVASHTWLPVWRGSRKQFTQRRTQPREFVWLYWVCDSDKFILSRLTAGRGGESGWVMGSINRKHPHLENDCK